MPAFQDIKRRIKSVQSTKKITKAMELVAAAKMRKSVARVLSTRGYANLAWRMLNDLAAKRSGDFHPLLSSRKVKRVGVLLISSNRGLCGAFNQNIIKKCDEILRLNFKDQQVGIEIALLGKKGRSIAKYGYQVTAEFEKVDAASSIKEILPIARMFLEGYQQGNYDQVLLVYTDFVSSLQQAPRVKQLLPLTKRDSFLGSVEGEDLPAEELADLDFIYEPSPQEVLEHLLPRLLEMQIYQAVLESDASEHSARMLAMRNASDAAGEMIDNLTLVYNQARQAAITAELADISGGRLALE